MSATTPPTRMAPSDRPPLSRRVTLGLAAAFAFGLLVFASPSRAQTELTTIYGGSQPTFSDQHVLMLTRMADLTPEQVEIITSLHLGYADEYRSQVTDIQSQIDSLVEALRSDIEPSIRTTLQREADALRAQRRSICVQLEHDLITDIRIVLNDDQQTGFENFTMARRRHLTMHVGARLDGEAIDVIAMADEFELDPEARRSVDIHLHAYAAQLDSILIQRNTLVDEMQSEAQHPDAKNRQHNAAQRTALAAAMHIDVRDLNWDFTRRIAGLLNPPQSWQWQRHFIQIAFPRDTRPTDADRTFEKAVNLLTIAPAQRGAIQRLHGSYLNQVVAIEQSILEIRFAAQAQSRLNVQDGPPVDRESEKLQVAQLQQQRRELSDDFVEQIHSVLSPDQINQLGAADHFPLTHPSARRYKLLGQYLTPASRWDSQEAA